MEKFYEFDGKRYVDVEYFSELCHVAVKQIKRRRNEIPGLIQREGQYYALYGTRYPISVKRYQIRDDYKRVFVLLKAIDQRKYIDHMMLGLYRESFDHIIDALLQQELVQEENLGNSYGANAYICTAKGAELVHEKQYEEVRRKIMLVCEGIGELIGCIFKVPKN